MANRMPVDFCGKSIVDLEKIGGLVGGDELRITVTDLESGNSDLSVIRKFLGIPEGDVKTESKIRWSLSRAGTIKPPVREYLELPVAGENSRDYGYFIDEKVDDFLRHVVARLEEGDEGNVCTVFHESDTVGGDRRFCDIDLLEFPDSEQEVCFSMYIEEGPNE